MSEFMARIASLAIGFPRFLCAEEVVCAQLALLQASGRLEISSNNVESVSD
jgi:hypothetical protein